MSKNPVSKSKPVKRNEPMRNALKFFVAGCVAEIYLLVIRRFYVNGTVEQLLACDAALPYLMGVGAAVAVVGLGFALLPGGQKFLHGRLQHLAGQLPGFHR